MGSPNKGSGAPKRSEIAPEDMVPGRLYVQQREVSTGMMSETFFVKLAGEGQTKTIGVIDGRVGQPGNSGYSDTGYCWLAPSIYQPGGDVGSALGTGRDRYSYFEADEPYLVRLLQVWSGNETRQAWWERVSAISELDAGEKTRIQSVLEQLESETFEASVDTRTRVEEALSDTLSAVYHQVTEHLQGEDWQVCYAVPGSMSCTIAQKIGAQEGDLISFVIPAVTVNGETMPRREQPGRVPFFYNPKAVDSVPSSMKLGEYEISFSKTTVHRMKHGTWVFDHVVHSTP